MLRLKPGCELELVDQGSHRSYRGRLTAIESNAGIVEIEYELPSLASSPVTLIVGAGKAAICDFIVEKSVELGVAHVAFFGGERSQGRLTIEQAAKRGLRFKRIVEAAVKQSGASGKPLQVTYCKDLVQILSKLHFSPKTRRELRLVLQPHSPNLLNVMRLETSFDFAALADNSAGDSPGAVTISSLEKEAQNAESYLIVGPEGGVTEDERAFALRHDYLEASLGPKVMRTETACLVGAALVSLFQWKLRA